MLCTCVHQSLGYAVNGELQLEQSACNLKACPGPDCIVILTVFTVLPYPRPIVVVMCLSNMVMYLNNVQIHILTVLTSVNRCIYLVLKAWMGIDMV